jgi:hypothetical protein
VYLGRRRGVKRGDRRTDPQVEYCREVILAMLVEVVLSAVVFGELLSFGALSSLSGALDF